MAKATKTMALASMESKEVLTTDGRVLGTLYGAWIDTSVWKVTALVIDVDKRNIEELDVKKHAFRAPKVSVTVEHVANVADVIQLNVTLDSLKGAIIEVGKDGLPE